MVTALSMATAMFYFNEIQQIKQPIPVFSKRRQVFPCMKNLIKTERARQNLTQAELAEKVNVSRQTINSVETGKFIPSSLLAFKIAQVLRVSADQLFELEDSDWN